ncbi:MAG TPA: efflux RND transporter periplasmic adaptor subunit [Steroidobacteraceae bacterium]|nr:efflux RND transporter periplasmic adaptor subunit [Gammaproteobacteria bacterium]HEV2286876.1 efflux RND transporter periplasmic adaptor subunit [Steroidobacteraceae bacterium]
MSYRLTLAAAAAAWLAACGGGHRGPVSAAQPALRSIVAERVSTPVERRLDGVIEAVNQGTVAAQTAGRVEAILYDVNDFVPAGAVIVRLRAAEQRAGLSQARASLQEAAAREADAQTRYQRIADMYERKVVPKATLDEAAVNKASAVAHLEAARAALQSAEEGVAYTEVRAPYAGVVTRRLVQVGETVSPGTPLMSGLSLQYLRVAVDVPQSIVAQVRRIRQGAVYVEGRRIEATRVTVFPEASAPSNTFRARLELPENAADLYPGMFVKVGFVTGEAQRILVPQEALLERSEITAVYVIGPDGRAALRQVRLGDRFGERLEIISGVSPGERVALDPLAAGKSLTAAADGAGGHS